MMLLNLLLISVTLLCFGPQVSMQVDTCSCDCTKCTSAPQIRVSQRSFKYSTPLSGYKKGRIGNGPVQYADNSTIKVSKFKEIKRSTIDKLADEISQSIKKEVQLMNRDKVTFARLKNARLQYVALNAVQRMNQPITKLAKNINLKDLDIVVTKIEKAVSDRPELRASSSRGPVKLSPVATEYIKIKLTQNRV